MERVVSHSLLLWNAPLEPKTSMKLHTQDQPLTSKNYNTPWEEADTKYTHQHIHTF